MEESPQVDFWLKIAEKFRIALLVLFGIFAQKLRHMMEPIGSILSTLMRLGETLVHL